MNYQAFQQAFAQYPAISTQEIEKAFPGFDRKVLVYWQHKGYILKIRNSWYCFAARSFTEQDLFLVSNMIYAPSYVSLESALAYFHLIPEGVFRITAVSTLKTAQFDTPLGTFQYRSILPARFFGYGLHGLDNRGYTFHLKLANPEKALLDYLYFNPQYRTEEDFLSLRLNWHRFNELVDTKKMRRYLQYLGSAALTNRAETLFKLGYARA